MTKQRELSSLEKHLLKINCNDYTEQNYSQQGVELNKKETERKKRERD